MTPDDLPFEYAFRWRDLYTDIGLTSEQASALEDRDRQLEDYLSATVVPLVFHWNGQVDRFVGIRNGPGEFRSDGSIYMIRYRWDTAPSTSSTLEWKLNGTTVMTHTLASGKPVHVEMPAKDYAQESIVSIISSVGADAKGLTAFVYFGP